MLVPMFDAQSKMVSKGAAAPLVNGTTIWTIQGGPIVLESLGCYCVTANDATASTLQWSVTGAAGAGAQTITGASPSIASAVVGSVVLAVPGTISSAPGFYTKGAGLQPANDLLVPEGIITIVVGVGSTTGTWRHFIRYRPLYEGVSVS